MAFTANELTTEAGIRRFGTDYIKALQPVYSGGGWKPLINEPFTGAWQRNMEEKRETLLTYPALYACLMRIATDIGKLPFQLKRRDENGIWKPYASSAYDPVLRKPNRYQTAQQFRESWLISKLTQGNAYIIKERDQRGVVTHMHVLDPCRVLPLVSDSGAVFYELNCDNLAGVREDRPRVPASEIIHDRCITLHHHLIGVPPLCAAHWPAVKNLRILKSASEFFGNSSQPGGILTAPAGISDEDAAALKSFWNENYSGRNAGRVAVLGADMKFTSLAQSGADSQLVEQMRYSDEQICQPFGISPFKIGIGTIPAGLKVDDINQVYYSDALQTHIEAMENLLDEGLQISMPLGIELDLEPLLRMDAEKRAAVWTSLTGGGISTPNEGRYQFGLSPLEGGDTVYMQQQDIPLSEARKNTIPEQAQPEQPTPIEPDQEETQRALIAAVNKAFDMVANGTL